MPPPWTPDTWQSLEDLDLETAVPPLDTLQGCFAEACFSCRQVYCPAQARHPLGLEQPHRFLSLTQNRHVYYPTPLHPAKSTIMHDLLNPRQATVWTLTGAAQLQGAMHWMLDLTCRACETCMAMQVDVYSPFRSVLERIWAVWELAILAQPLLVVAPSPGRL